LKVRIWLYAVLFAQAAAILAGMLYLKQAIPTLPFEIVDKRRIYFVHPDGNDANNCLTDSINPADSPNGACATWGRVTDILERLFILPGVSVVVRAAGSGVREWSSEEGEPIASFEGWGGGGSVVLDGDRDNPGNVKLAADNAAVFRVRGLIGDGLTIRGFTLSASGREGRAIRHGGIGHVHLIGNHYGQEAMCQVENPLAYLDHAGAQAIVGDVTIDKFIDADAGYVYMGTGTFDIAGTVTVTTAFAVARLGGRLLAHSETYHVTGSVLGRKYVASDGGSIMVQDAGENRFPGTLAGTRTRGGSYDGSTR
jgi:hypothetical protein